MIRAMTPWPRRHTVRADPHLSWKGFMRLHRLLTLAAALAAAGLLMLGTTAQADIASELGAAGPSHYAIFALGGVNLNMTDATLNGPGQTMGNVGIASSGNIALNSSTPPAIIGNLYLGNSSTTNGSAGNLAAQVSGTIFTNQDAVLGTGSVPTPPGFWGGGTVTASGAVAQALNAAKFFNSLTPDLTLSSITSTTTLTTTSSTHTSGYYVVNVTGNINLGNNQILNLVQGSGVSGVQFVLNVAGNISLNGGNNFSGGEIRVSGLNNTDVVINVTSTSSGDNVTASGGSSPDPSHPGNTLPNAYIQGILLDVAGGIGFSPGMVFGEIIGGGNEIRLVSGSQVNGSSSQTPTAPEPSSMAMVLVIGGLAISRYAWRHRRSK